MKKTLIIIISLLIAFSLAIVLFVVGLESTRERMGEKEEKQETQKYREETEKPDKSEDAISHDYKYEPEEEENKGEVIDEEKEGIVIDGDETSDKKIEEEQNSETWYRVRKTAGDKNSQIGAFKSLNKAKALADSNKKDGYEVYDGNKCVYKP